jgi:DNA-binding response OmpR family regulator
MIQMTAPQYRRRECTIDGRTLKLKGTCYIELVALLLVSHPDRFVPLDELIEATWPDPDFEPDFAVSVLSVRLHRLRQKGIPIENDWGFGWRIPRWAREEIQMAEAA